MKIFGCNGFWCQRLFLSFNNWNYIAPMEFQWNAKLFFGSMCIDTVWMQRALVQPVNVWLGFLILRDTFIIPKPEIDKRKKKLEKRIRIRLPMYIGKKEPE